MITAFSKIKRDLLLIEFDDHASDTVGWLKHTEVDDEQGLPCRAIGWKLLENDKILVITNFESENASVSRHYIIKSTITKRQKVKL